MTINLYYIEGISRIDTPYFATKTYQATLSKQQEFFDNHIVKSVQLAFYPPHYRNVIKFNDDDLTFNTQVNYLSLEYGNKRYYYFIDNINYLSESIIEVEITMDVIQTYMFDIYISNGIIERKFISRWRGSYLNRDYIRENVSDNEFVFHNITTLNDDVHKWMLFVSTTKYYNMSGCNVEITYTEKTPGVPNGTSIFSAFPFYIVSFADAYHKPDPYYSEIGTGSFSESTGHQDYERVDSYTQFSFFASRDWVNNIYLCPFECCDGLTVTYNANLQKYLINFVNEPYDYFINRHLFNIGGNVEIPMFNITLGDGHTKPDNFDRNIYSKFVSKVNSYTTNILNLTRNMSVGVTYNSKYITQMLDENYVRIKFGSITAFTTIPLNRLTSDAIYCKYTFNPTDGTRTYWITSSNNGDDIYNTAVIDTNVLYSDLKNDPWIQYLSQNRSRYVAAGLDTAISIFSKGMVNTQMAKFAEQEITDIKSNPKNYDKRYKEPKLKNKPSSMVEKREQDISKFNLGSKVNAISSIASNIGGQFIKDANIRAIPPSAKQISNISGINAKEAMIMVYDERVLDFEQCAQFYHRNGFLVNEYINANDNIFGSVNNRYYFNVLKMSVPNVHLHNVIEDEDTIQAISDRLVDGIRLWNVNNTGVVIGDFQYDNVENMYA